MAIEVFSPPPSPSPPSPSPPPPYYQLLERGSARLGRVKKEQSLFEISTSHHEIVKFDK